MGSLNEATTVGHAVPGAAPALKLVDVSKSFGGAPALRGVSLRVEQGEIVSLAGENGAGKSTIKNLVGGLLHHDSGRIELFGQRQAGSVAAVRAQGVATVHQEISLFADLSVAENLLITRLGTRLRYGVDARRLAQLSRSYLERVGATFSPDRLVGTLSTGETQLVEIAKALTSSPRLLILDEPTASLTMREREHVYAVIAQLRRDGVAILFISHFLEEILALSDRVAVLRDGALVADRPARELDRASLEELMVGRELAAGFPEVGPPSERVLLRVDGLGDGEKIADVSFEVRAGEIFGFVGLMGSGRTEVARAIFGLAPAIGTVAVDGIPIVRSRPEAAIAAGIGFVTEDRRDEGIFLQRPIRETLSVASLKLLARPSWSGWIDRRREREVARQQAKTMGVTARGGLEANGISLSGGNQQKVVIAKWLQTRPRILLLDEPTRGIDVGAKAEIYRLLAELAAEGVAIVLISSEMEEVLGLSHRIAVMSEGRLRQVLDRSKADQKTIIRLATGGEL